MFYFTITLSLKESLKWCFVGGGGRFVFCSNWQNHKNPKTWWGKWLLIWKEKQGQGVTYGLWKPLIRPMLFSPHFLAASRQSLFVHLQFAVRLTGRAKEEVRGKRRRKLSSQQQPRQKRRCTCAGIQSQFCFSKERAHVCNSFPWAWLLLLFPWRRTCYF